MSLLEGLEEHPEHNHGELFSLSPVSSAERVQSGCFLPFLPLRCLSLSALFFSEVSPLGC